jgi:hypothetical protein
LSFDKTLHFGPILLLLFLLVLVFVVFIPDLEKIIKSEETQRITKLFTPKNSVKFFPSWILELGSKRSRSKFLDPDPHLRVQVFFPKKL